MRKNLIMFFIITIFLMNCSKSNSPSVTETPKNDTPDFSITGNLTFFSNMDGDYEIFILGNSGLIQITNNSIPDAEPFISPDGKNVVFTRIINMQTLEAELWLYKIDTGNEKKLTTVNAFSSVSWKSDSSQIVFTKDVGSNIEIFKIDIDGNTETRLTYNTGADIEPEWSLTGDKIVFCSHKDGNQEIYVMNSDGGGQTRLTNNNVKDEYPKWSPAGNKIIFVSDRDEWHGEIYMMNADATGMTRLTYNTAEEYLSQYASPWSSDGNKIVFVSVRDSKEEIYIMDSDGNNQIRLTDSSEENSNPVFSTDGNKIAFLRWFDNGTNADIYIMNKDGTGETRITNTSASEILTGWK